MADKADGRDITVPTPRPYEVLAPLQVVHRLQIVSQSLPLVHDHIPVHPAAAQVAIWSH